MKEKIEITWNGDGPRSDCLRWFSAGNRALMSLTIFKKGRQICCSIATTRLAQ